MALSTDKPIRKAPPPDRQSVKDGLKDLKNTPPKPKKFTKAAKNQYRLC